MVTSPTVRFAESGAKGQEASSANLAFGCQVGSFDPPHPGLARRTDPAAARSARGHSGNSRGESSDKRPTSSRPRTRALEPDARVSLWNRSRLGCDATRPLRRALMASPAYYCIPGSAGSFLPTCCPSTCDSRKLEPTRPNTPESVRESVQAPEMSGCLEVFDSRRVVSGNSTFNANRLRQRAAAAGSGMISASRVRPG